MTRPLPPLPERSIAVLPFENLSPDANDSFYTTGVQDEITADLARVAALKVISPDSGSQYPPGARDFTRIGTELGVRYLLTGTVRREREQVKIEIQLVDAVQPSQPWVKQYDRRLADVFLLPGEIARTVADHLQAPLSHREKGAIDLPPTTDQVAYDLYLRARAISTMTVGAAQSREVFGRSLALLAESTQRDPHFFQAYCAIADLEDELATLHTGTPEEMAVDHRARAESALAAARRLRPDDDRIHLVDAKHLATIVRDLAQAKIEVDLARRTLPNSAGVETITATIAENTGHWEEATHARERAVALNPRDPGNYANLEQNYRMLRRYELADRTLGAFIAMMPREEVFPVYLERAVEQLEGRADLTLLRATLAPAPSGEEPAEVNLFRFLLAYFARDADGLTRALAAAPQEQFQMYNFTYPKMWFVGLNARLRGDAAGEREAFTAARVQAEKLLNANPAHDAGAMSLLAMIDAALGRKEEAVQEALKACEMLPETQAAATTAVVHNNLAVVYAWTGQPALAFAELETWTKRPAGANLVYQPSYGDLKLNPVWDPLRGDARFASLVAQLAPPK